jgi:hypothetical protein
VTKPLLDEKIRTSWVIVLSPDPINDRTIDFKGEYLLIVNEQTDD